MSTAGPAWGDTARTQEAPVLLEGAGLANVAAANDPKLFTDPQSLSFRRPRRHDGRAAASKLAHVADAGGGAGTWTVELAPQAQTSGVYDRRAGARSRSLPAATSTLPVLVHAAADAVVGENYGVHRPTGNGDLRRRVPYAFLVERPGPS